MQRPKVHYEQLHSGTHLVRFNDIQDMFYYDEYDNNPSGCGMKYLNDYTSNSAIDTYKKTRMIMTSSKRRIIAAANKSLERDKEFLELVYKAKSAKRNFKQNKFGGNLSMVHYVTNADKIFKKNSPGAKKATLNMAFQVGIFSGQDYTASFVKILKVIFMAQAFGINLNIDMFDSDVRGIDHRDGYVICNVARSTEKLSLRKVLACSHKEFFHYTLFNGYSAAGMPTGISGYLSDNTIKEDLSEFYDVIGGNTLNPEVENNELISRILKIGLR